MEFTPREVQRIGAGEILANMGEVVGTRAEGAFVHLTVKTEIWSPVTGTHMETFENHFFHCTDELIVRS